MERVKTALMHIGICIGLLILIWSGYIYGMKKISQTIDYVIEDDFSWVIQVDKVKTEKNEFVLEGFAFKLNQDAEEGAFDIVLHDLDTNKYLFPEMVYVDRKDVNEYFLCEYDYTKSGFEARIKMRRIDLRGNDYEVLLRPKESNNSYRFTTYLENGNLMYANPKEYIPLNVEGTDLEEITEKGILRVYKPDKHIYVYQYDGSMYWIAEEKYGFVEEDARLQYQLYTTQVEQLPEISLDNNWVWNNLVFDFSMNEMFGKNTGKYRVTKNSYLVEHSITGIETGDYIDDWLWYAYFRPIYEFEK